MIHVAKLSRSYANESNNVYSLFRESELYNISQYVLKTFAQFVQNGHKEGVRKENVRAYVGTH